MTLLDAVAHAPIFRRSGTVLRANGEMVTTAGLNLAHDELVVIDGAGGQSLTGQFAASIQGETRVAMLDRGNPSVGGTARATGRGPSAPFGPQLLGRVLDGLGRPIDRGGPLGLVRCVPISAEPPDPLDREPIVHPLPVGVRAIDGFLTLGRGQRVGVFAGSGVGKSTLLGMLARGATADVTVIALIGERGREVRDFLEQDLGLEALKRCVVVASTGDNPAAMRICAARAATAIAEGFRAEGLDVLLLFDSLTRVAMAQREIGLAAGEPPTTRGYPPSVFSMLPHLMERAGPAARGSITAIYTILVDGEDMDEPIADISRATLDGHIVLKRSIATAGHYPPIDVLASVSRLMTRVTSPAHGAAARHLRQLMAAHEEARDLISIGAYVPGADPVVDRAIALMPAINDFLQQRPEEVSGFDAAIERLLALAPPHHTEEMLDGPLDSALEEAGDLP